MPIGASGVITQPGQFNGSGNSLHQFEDIFTLEVEATFENQNIADSIQQVKTITHGRSAVFDIYGDMEDPDYHIPGELINPNTMKFGQRTISVDGLCLQSAQLPEIFDKMAHYDSRQPAVEKIGYSLAKQYHRNVFAVALNGARMNATDLTNNGFVDGIPANGGVSGTGRFGANGDANFTGSFWVDSCFAAAERFDELNIPENDRCLIVRPRDYYRLASQNEVLNADYGSRGSGLTAGKVLEIAGIKIMKTNYLPNSNIARVGSAAATGAGPQNFKSVQVGAGGGASVDIYGGNFTKTRGLFMQKRALATVKLIGISTEIAWERLYQSHVAISKYAVGHGILRPDCLLEVRDTSA